MDYLWTPWRYAYITGADQPHPANVGVCLFCAREQAKDDKAALIVYRGKHCYIILNAFPYTSGHVMVVPHAHVSEIAKLSADAAAEIMHLSQRMEGVLRELYHPDGLNIGMNIGKAAGAGIAEHLHMHVLPRWVADANFMSVIGETRMLPETLDVTWERISEKLKSEL
jgi:ATP adenylyltransferase